MIQRSAFCFSSTITNQYIYIFFFTKLVSVACVFLATRGCKNKHECHFTFRSITGKTFKIFFYQDSSLLSVYISCIYIYPNINWCILLLVCLLHCPSFCRLFHFQSKTTKPFVIFTENCLDGNLSDSCRPCQCHYAVCESPILLSWVIYP